MGQQPVRVLFSVPSTSSTNSGASEAKGLKTLLTRERERERLGGLPSSPQPRRKKEREREGGVRTLNDTRLGLRANGLSAATTPHASKQASKQEGGVARMRTGWGARFPIPKRRASNQVSKTEREREICCCRFRTTCHHGGRRDRTNMSARGTLVQQSPSNKMVEGVR